MRRTGLLRIISATIKSQIEARVVIPRHPRNLLGLMLFVDIVDIMFPVRRT